MASVRSRPADAGVDLLAGSPELLLDFNALRRAEGVGQAEEVLPRGRLRGRVVVVVTGFS